MKWLPIFILLGMIASCKQEEISALPGKWKMVGIASAEGKVFFVKPSNEKGDVILEFPAVFPTSFTGKAVCNEFWGEFETLGGRNLKVEKYGGTQVYCPSWGTAFEDRISSVNSYKISNDRILYLNLEEERMVFFKIK